MPHNKRPEIYLEKFNLHKQQAESYKSQHSFDAALEEYIEAMEQLKAARLENKNRSNILYIFQSESFDDQNATAIKLGIAECYLAKDDLENAHKTFTQIQPDYLADVETFNRLFDDLKHKITLKADMLLEKANMLNNLVGEPFKYASVNQQTWDRMRDRVNKESSFMLSSNVQRAFDLLRIYECNAKFLNKEEKQLHNKLLDKYEQFDSGRHPMAAPTSRL